MILILSQLYAFQIKNQPKKTPHVFLNIDNQSFFKKS